MKSVQVLMSTYNGEQYIEEQLDSILNQEDVSVFVKIRDDGSTDNTVEILKSYQERYDNIEISVESNIGYERSFMRLLCTSGEYDYYAFSDQDDVWLPQKLIEAIKKMEQVGEKEVIAYHSWMTYVDENLEKMNVKKQVLFPENKIMHLFQNYVQGSTMVINRSARELICKNEIECKVSHDVWIPIVCDFCGKVIFDYESFILYRQHNNNVTNSNGYYTRLIKKIFSKQKINNYAKYLLKYYSEQISNEDRKTLEIFERCNESIGNKICVVMNKSVRRYTVKGTLLLKMAILFGRLD